MFRLLNYIISFFFKTELLWRAPELLRQSTGSFIKGDVYSFGIMLYEIALRSGPYGNTDLMAEGL